MTYGPSLDDFDLDNKQNTHLNRDPIPRGIADTSIAAYKDLKSHPFEIHGRQLEYLLQLKEIGHAATDQEVKTAAKKSDPNYFRPRRKELYDMGLVARGEKRSCHVTGKTVYTWFITPKGRLLVEGI